VLPVYVDSPMAIGALQFYSSRLNELDAEFHRRGQTGSDPESTQASDQPAA
jgi:hypothetical protein